MHVIIPLDLYTVPLAPGHSARLYARNLLRGFCFRCQVRTLGDTERLATGASNCAKSLYTVKLTL